MIILFNDLMNLTFSSENIHPGIGCKLLDFSSAEPRTHKVSLKHGTRAGVRPFVSRPCVTTLSNMNIIETSWQVAIKFYLNHHWGGGCQLGFGPDLIRTLVSMATYSSHSGENLVTTPVPSFLFRSSSFLQLTRKTMKTQMSSKFA